MKSNRSASAATGEYLVLGELLKRGFEAYLAHGETQKGWDIVIIEQSAVKRIQIKTINWPTSTAVNGKLTEGFDFLIVVLLNCKEPRSRFLIFSVGEMASLISNLNEKRKGKEQTLTINKSSIIKHKSIDIYEDMWSILKPESND